MDGPRCMKKLSQPNHHGHQGHHGVSDEVLKLLPPVLKAVVGSLGFFRAKDFLLDYGGINVYVPLGKNTGKLKLSDEEFERFSQAVAPFVDDKRRLWLPKADKLLIHVRNRELRTARNNMSINELALRYRITRRHVLNICHETDDRQVDLFD